MYITVFTCGNNKICYLSHQSACENDIWKIMWQNSAFHHRNKIESSYFKYNRTVWLYFWSALVSIRDSKALKSYKPQTYEWYFIYKMLNNVNRKLRWMKQNPPLIPQCQSFRQISLNGLILGCLPPSDCESRFVCKPLQLEALTDYENIISTRLQEIINTRVCSYHPGCPPKPQLLNNTNILKRPHSNLKPKPPWSPAPLWVQEQWVTRQFICFL